MINWPSLSPTKGWRNQFITITHRSEMLKTIVRVIFVILGRVGVARGGVILPKHHVAWRGCSCLHVTTNRCDIRHVWTISSVWNRTLSLVKHVVTWWVQLIDNSDWQVNVWNKINGHSYQTSSISDIYFNYEANANAPFQQVSKWASCHQTSHFHILVNLLKKVLKIMIKYKGSFQQFVL